VLSTSQRAEAPRNSPKLPDEQQPQLRRKWVLALILVFHFGLLFFFLLLLGKCLFTILSIDRFGAAPREVIGDLIRFDLCQTLRRLVHDRSWSSAHFIELHSRGLRSKLLVQSINQSCCEDRACTGWAEASMLAIKIPLCSRQDVGKSVKCAHVM